VTPSFCVLVSGSAFSGFGSGITSFNSLQAAHQHTYDDPCGTSSIQAVDLTAWLY